MRPLPLLGVLAAVVLVVSWNEQRSTITRLRSELDDLESTLTVPGGVSIVADPFIEGAYQYVNGDRHSPYEMRRGHGRPRSAP